MSSIFSTLGLSSIGGTSLAAAAGSVVVGGVIATVATVGVTQSQQAEAPSTPPSQEQLFSYSQ